MKVLDSDSHILALSPENSPRKKPEKVVNVTLKVSCRVLNPGSIKVDGGFGCNPEAIPREKPRRSLGVQEFWCQSPLGLGESVQVFYAKRGKILPRCRKNAALVQRTSLTSLEIMKQRRNKTKKLSRNIYDCLKQYLISKD